MPEKNAFTSDSALEKCNECEECKRVCSIFLHASKHEPYNKLKVAREIAQNSKKPKDWETVFFCTKCEACDVACPEGIPITKIIDDARKTCVEKWGIQYPRQAEIIENIINTGNPFGHLESRTAWLNEKMPVDSKILLHLGCMISFPNSRMGKNIVSILRKLGIDFTISPDEFCCGYFVHNTGNHEVARQIIKKNSMQFEKYDQIIVACAGCYTFMKEHYPIKNQVKHVIEIIDEQLKVKSLNINKDQGLAIFHDSCHLSRPHGIIEPPRRVLEKIGFNLVEFDLTREEGLCCGADGGMRIINLPFALEMGKKRLLQASSKCKSLITLCPFCIHNFKESADKFSIKIRIRDLFEELNTIL